MTNEKLGGTIDLLLEHVPEKEKGNLLAKIGRVDEGIEYYRERNKFEEAIALSSKYHKPVKKLKKEAVAHYKEKLEYERENYRDANSRWAGTVSGLYGAMSAESGIREYTTLIKKLQRDIKKGKK